MCCYAHAYYINFLIRRKGYFLSIDNPLLGYVTPDKSQIYDMIRRHTLYLHGLNGGTRANFFGLDLTGFDFSGTDLTWANFSNTDLSFANFSECDLCRTDFSKSVQLYTNFMHASLPYAKFKNCTIIKSDFSDSELSEIQLNECNIYKTKFIGAHMNHAAIDKNIMRDLDWSESAILNTGFYNDLVNISFAQSKLHNVRFAGSSELSNLNFTKAEIIACDLVNTKLVSCDFAKAKILGGSFEEAKFDRCKLKGTFLSPTTKFKEAITRGNKFSNPLQHLYFYLRTL
jgi:uncharacterized protein YjbI with pentapeptide repeats